MTTTSFPFPWVKTKQRIPILVCVCVRARACVCVWEREREREYMHTSVCKYSYENMGWDVSYGEIHVWFPFKFIDQSFRLSLILATMNDNNQPQQQKPNPNPNPNVLYKRTRWAQKIWINIVGTNLQDVRVQMDFSNCICIVNGVPDGGGDQFPMAILVPVEICEQCFMFF